MKKILSGLVIVTVILVLSAGIAIIYRNTNGFNEEFKTFLLEKDGEQILSSNSKTLLRAGEAARYDVKYIFDTPVSEARDYNVSITPNPDADFSFKIGDYSLVWRRAEGLEKLFGLEKNNTYFTFSAPSCHDLSGLVKSLYPEIEGEVIVDPPTTEEGLFLLTVSSYNGKVLYSIELTVQFVVSGDPANVELSFFWDADHQQEVQPWETLQRGGAYLTVTCEGYTVASVSVLDGDTWRQLNHWNSNDFFFASILADEVKFKILLYPDEAGKSALEVEKTISLAVPQENKVTLELDISGGSEDMVDVLFRKDFGDESAEIPLEKLSAGMTIYFKVALKEQYTADYYVGVVKFCNEEGYYQETGRPNGLGFYVMEIPQSGEIKLQFQLFPKE